jgi:photosystem II stability/assembly factor-like uncharacterized protein
MKNLLTPFIALAFIAGGAFLILHFEEQPALASHPSEQELEWKALPNDWMYDQRAYPNNYIDRETYQEALLETKKALADQGKRGNPEKWKLAGPINIGGRITDLALHPTEQNIMYAGASVGGVWKSTDGGINWYPVFENAGANSVGNIAIAPSEPNTLYVGTGEANGSFASGAFFGDGVWKTTDGGQSWTHAGLEKTNHIGRIAVDPADANRVFVAAAGVLYGKNEDRGLFRTLDGGQTWKKVLYLSDSTACIDVAINPQYTNTVFAATWERIRYPWQRRYGGLTSRIYRSTDGGNSWQQLTTGLPPNSDQRGRIGLAIAPSSPNVIYASYTTNPITNVFDGIYRSSDGGNTWWKKDDGSINNVYSSFGWFFGNVRVAPDNADEVFCLGVPMFRSLDGGKSWAYADAGMHVDHHALEIHPLNPDFMVDGNDGGLYLSKDGSLSWEHVEVLPLTMFYQCEIDNLAPERLYGGTQDNGTLRTMTGNLDDWERILGGDGFHVIVDPTDNKYVYAEYQYGNFFRSNDGGENFTFSFSGGYDDRKNWNTPVVIDPSNPATLYYGSNILYRSTNRGESWGAISGDLTKGLHPSGSLAFGTISTIAVAPSNPKTIYVGTDDGTVQVTFDGGNTWKNISSGIPDRYVTELAVHPADASTAFVTLSGFRHVDYQPHILMTNDGGTTWKDISGNLPEIPINDVIVDPQFNDVLYIANDLGVWYSPNLGGVWDVLGSDMPLTVVNDLVFHANTRTMVAATFGRSLQKIDLSNFMPPTASTEELKRVKGSLSVFPNPVWSHAFLQIELPASDEVIVDVFNIHGQRITVLKKGFVQKGKHVIEWDTEALQPGCYLVYLRTGKGVLSLKVLKAN